MFPRTILATTLASLLFAASVQAQVATLTEKGIWLVGSGAAAVMRCEVEKFIPLGDGSDYIIALQKNLAPEIMQKVRRQYQLSLHEHKVYVPSKDRWLSFHPTQGNCDQIAKALPVMVRYLEKLNGN